MKEDNNEDTASPELVENTHVVTSRKVFVPYLDGLTVSEPFPSEITSVPPGYYTLESSKDGVMYLSPTKEPKRLAKAYGNHRPRLDRIIQSWAMQGKSMGVLLSGMKGTGKTLLVSNICTHFCEEGLPIIMVNTSYRGSTLLRFLSHIPKSVVVFDEFEKVYVADEKEDDYSSQNSILGLLDGMVGTTNHLFLLTTNTRKIAPSLLGRPGRIRYHWRYEGLTPLEILEVITDQFPDRTEEDQRKMSIFIADYVGMVTYDSLSSVIDELRRFEEPIIDTLQCLNIDRISNRSSTYTMELTVGSETRSLGEIHTTVIFGSSDDWTEVRLNLASLEKPFAIFKSSLMNERFMLRTDMLVEDNFDPVDRMLKFDVSAQAQDYPDKLYLTLYKSGYKGNNYQESMAGMW